MKYPFKVYQTQAEKHVFWVAECPCLKGCVGQGDTIDDAIQSLEENETVWLETAAECGIEIPSIPLESVNEYSGKFTVRVAPSVHKAAAFIAQKEGISLNQYVNDAIVSQNSRYDTVGYMAPQLKEAVEEFKELLFDSVPSSSHGSIKVSIPHVFPAFEKPGTTTNSKNDTFLHIVESL